MISAIKVNNAAVVAKAMEAYANRKPPKWTTDRTITFTEAELSAIIGSLSATAEDGSLAHALWVRLRKL